MSKSISLSVIDRLHLKQLFPQNANMLKLALMKDISGKIDLSQEEMKDYEFKLDGDRYYVSVEKVKDKYKIAEFSEAEIDFLKSRITELDKQEAISMALYDLCSKIKNNEVCTNA